MLKGSSLNSLDIQVNITISLMEIQHDDKKAYNPISMFYVLQK